MNTDISNLLLVLVIFIYVLNIIFQPVIASSFPTTSQESPQAEGMARSFTASELAAHYELMVQFKNGEASNCPVAWSFTGTPERTNGSIILSQENIQVFEENQSCSGNSNKSMTLLMSTYLKDARLKDFLSSIKFNIDKTTVFDSVYEQLSRRLFFVTSMDSSNSLTCSDGKRWFDNDEMFLFLDVIDAIVLPLVAEVHNGDARIHAIPLLKNVRYMIAVTSGSTCIYRVDADLRILLVDILAPYQSPLPSSKDARSSTSSPPNSELNVYSVLNNPSPVVIIIPSSTPCENQDKQSPISIRSVSPIDDIPTESPTVSAPIPEPSLSEQIATPKEIIPSQDSFPSFVSSVPFKAVEQTEEEETLLPSPEVSHNLGDNLTQHIDKDVIIQSSEDATLEDDEDEDPEETEIGNVYGGRSCFPGSSTVALENGRVIKMKKVRIGDSVSVGNGQFSKVFMFTHRHERTITRFISLKISNGAVITATPGHFIYVDGRLTGMRKVKAGQKVTMGNGEGAYVTGVRLGTEAGMYNPHTMDGDIVVNGVKASCYTEVIPVEVAHALLVPFRALDRLYSIALTETWDGIIELLLR